MKSKKLLRWHNAKSIALSLSLGLAFAAGITFAWNAVWHGTDWIGSGKVISSQQIAENLEYLYQRAGKLPANGCQNVGEVLQWDGNQFICATISASNVSICSNPEEQLLNGNVARTVADCSEAGGTAVLTDDGCLCKFAGSSCPAGWTQYLNYTQTQAASCASYREGGTSCQTGNHAFANMPVESCGYIEACGPKGGEFCPTAACYATVTYIGCK